MVVTARDSFIAAGERLGGSRRLENVVREEVEIAPSLLRPLSLSL